MLSVTWAFGPPIAMNITAERFIDSKGLCT